MMLKLLLLQPEPTLPLELLLPELSQQQGIYYSNSKVTGTPSQGEAAEHSSGKAQHAGLLQERHRPHAGGW